MLPNARNCATLEDVSGRHVTTGKAAEALGVSLTTLQRWAHQGLVTPALRTAGGHFRWDLDDLRGQLNAMNPTAQHDSASFRALQPVVAAIVTSKMGVLIGRRNDGKPPWTFIAGEIEPGESSADAGCPRSQRRNRTARHSRARDRTPRAPGHRPHHDLHGRAADPRN